MNYEPMLRARINSFKISKSFTDIKEDKLFELFVNHTILKSHQPDVDSEGDSILDECSVGGMDDLGLDGLAIKVNGAFVSTKQDVDELIELNKQIAIEFLFIQSKNKDKLDSGEYGKFVDGITDFLSSEHHEPHNEKIDALLQVKEYLFSDSIILRWKSNPVVRVYYVISGNWRESKHFEAKTAKLKQNVKAMQSYENLFLNFIDNGALKKMCEGNENSFSTVMTVIDSFGLTEVNDVDNSLIVLLSATELVKMITTDEKLLRLSLFTDNVRGYQGATDINSQIMKTIKETPSNFALFNNGITIVCNSVMVSNRKVTLSNPQVVNGCQTCNVLFDAYATGIDLSKITLFAKIIATEKDEITTAVIKGTNSQNIVYNEAFETTRDFHKNLEEFFGVIQADMAERRIYYERRSRQYIRDTNIPFNRIIGLRAMTQSYVSIFMHAPHYGTSHEATLLKKYKNSIFVDGQSLFSYYMAALMCLNFDQSIYDGKIPRQLSGFKHHILMIAAEQVAGICPNINNNEKIDSYCDNLIKVVTDMDSFSKVLNNSYEIMKEVTKLWVEQRGRQYRHGIKDNADFTAFLLTYIRGGDITKVDYDVAPQLLYRGRVIKARKDRNGFYYGFIQHDPEDVFFHERDNEGLDFGNIYGKEVLYRIFPDTYNGDDRAEIIELVF